MSDSTLAVDAAASTSTGKVVEAGAIQTSVDQIFGLILIIALQIALDLIGRALAERANVVRRRLRLTSVSKLSSWCTGGWLGGR